MAFSFNKAFLLKQSSLLQKKFYDIGPGSQNGLDQLCLQALDKNWRPKVSENKNLKKLFEFSAKFWLLD